MLKFLCDQCRQGLRISGEHAGKKVRCPYCQAVVTAPEFIPAVAEKSAGIGIDDSSTNLSGALSKPTTKIDQEELIDMTAMVDIVFFLLIFFLVTSMSAVHSSMPTPVPETQGGGQSAVKSIDEIQAEGDVVTVRIHQDDQVEIDGIPISDLSDLPSRLEKLRFRGWSRMGLLVLAHGDASHGTAVAVLDAGYEAGMERVRLGVSDTD